jgi:hypothetical protein
MDIRKCVLILAPVMLLGQSDASSPSNADLAKQIAEMNAVIQRRQRRVDELEAKQSAALPLAATARHTANTKATAADQPALPPSDQVVPSEPAISNFLRGTSVNVLVDTYYDYNFNDPIGRVNRLRAYDVVSNASSLNQATIIFDNEPDVSNGKRWGARVDLQFGQATETLQANAANEPRPEVYRNIFQAFGTHVVHLGAGLKVDFGKWASSLGFEGNFTQDQINYTRSYWFNFLPFYKHGGANQLSALF